MTKDARVMTGATIPGRIRRSHNTDSVSDAIRAVTAKMQRNYKLGKCSLMVDLHDVIEMMLAIADRIDNG